MRFASIAQRSALALQLYADSSVTSSKERSPLPLVDGAHSNSPCQLVTTLQSPGFEAGLFSASKDHAKPAVARLVSTRNRLREVIALGSLSSQWLKLAPEGLNGVGRSLTSRQQQRMVNPSNVS